jgi:hypothetical protein
MSSVPKVRITVSGSSCTCCGFKEVDQVPSRPVFYCTDEVLQLQEDMRAREDTTTVTFSAYAAALKALVKEKTRAIRPDMMALPPVPFHHVAAHREHAPSFSFLWSRGATAWNLTSDYGIDAEDAWEYVAALFFLHRACGNFAMAAPSPPSEEVAIASERIKVLHAAMKDRILPAAAEATKEN